MGNIIFAVLIFAIVVVLLMGLVRSIKIQHEGKVGVVEAWGRFSRVLAPGRFILWPWERVVGELPLQMFEWETKPQKLMLRGGSPMTLAAVIYYQIEHAHKTAGAPRPPRIIGTTPAPVGNSLANHTPTPAVTHSSHSRAGLGIDSLEPAAHTGAQRRAGTPTATVRQTGVMLLNRVTGRGGGQLDVTHAVYRAKYVVHDWQEATHKEAVAVLQHVFSRISVAEDINGDINWQETLGRRVADHLNEKTEQWGVHIIDVTFKDPALSEMTLMNLNAEARTDREGRVRTKEAESYRRVAEILGLNPADLLRWREVEIMRELSKSQPRVMFSTGMAGMSGGRPADATMQPLSPQNPVIPLLASDGSQSAVPAMPLNGYLGNEPPTPALSANMMAAGQTVVSPTAGSMVAPSIRSADQQ